MRTATTGFRFWYPARLLLILVILTGLLAHPQPVQADYTIAQEARCYSSSYFGNGLAMGQSFTTLGSGWIYQVDLFLGEGMQGKASQLRIYPGAIQPNNPAQALHNQAFTPTCSGCWTSIALAPTVPVSADSVYTLEMMADSPSWLSCEGYAGGTMWWSGRPSPIEDATFRVWVEELRCYVNQAATGGNTGLDWANAFTDLQTALGKPQCGDIWVAAGVYHPNDGDPTDLTRTRSFALHSGVAVYGGFAGHETARDQRDWLAYPAVLSGEIGVPGVTTDNSIHVVTADGAAASTVLDGFTITSGYADLSSPLSHQWGGGMYLLGSALTIRNVIFANNEAYGGGGLFVDGGQPVLVNVLFTRNGASVNGGAVHTYGGANLSLTNVTISDNRAAANGGGIAIWDTSRVTLTNTIVWGNTSPNNPTLFRQATGTLAAGYSLLMGGCPAWATCDTHLLTADPLYVDALAGNYRLRAGSPAIDAGDNTAPGLAGIPTDLEGSPRLVNMGSVPDTGRGTPPVVDLGAYEAQVGSPVVYVDKSAPGLVHDGASWATAFSGLQAALAAAEGGQEIWVAAGVYAPGFVREASFPLKDGVAVYGGFAGTETQRDQRDWHAHPTLLSGDIGAVGDASDNNCHVVTGSGVSATAILDGFTISGGNATGAGCDGHGGGISNISSSPTLANLTISGNTAIDGGGMYDQHGSPSLVNVTFHANSAWSGGGMHNFAWLQGLTAPTLTNVTFSGNTATYGGGMYNEMISWPTLTNCILWGNTASGVPTTGQFNFAAAVTYSDIQGGYPGVGNIDQDPLFVDAAGGNLRLRAGSPAIDAGDTNAPELSGILTDLDGNPRTIGESVDVGAYEFWPHIYLPAVRR